MKNTFWFISILFLTAFCKEDEGFSPSNPTLSKNEGWPAEYLLIEFENSDFDDFTVKFGSTIASTSAKSNGLQVTVPTNLPKGETVSVTMKTPKGIVTLSENFMVRAMPTISYSNRSTYSYRLPLKAKIRDLDFLDIYAVEMCSNGFCYSITYEFIGDTIVIKNGNLARATMKVSGTPNVPLDASKTSFTESLEFFNTFTYRPSFGLQTNTGKRLDNLNIVFNDSNYFPDDIVVKMKSATGIETTLTCSNFDYVSAPGYFNANIGQYKIPDTMTNGEYTFVVKDIDGIEYLPEPPMVYTVTD